jgi:hypothetical protein
MEKKCNICDSVKNIGDFYKNQTRCKSCTKQYSLDNKNRIKEYKRSYREKNRETLNISDNKYYQDNKDIIREKQRIYYDNNREEIKEIQRKYREENREILTLKNREYTKKYKISKSSDKLWILSSNIRSMMGNSFRNNGYSKKSKTENILGCTFEDFKLYLESKFEVWMNWENHGKFNSELNYGWDIDHIIPLDTAETEDDIIKLNHFTNLQPLCSYTNRHIKMYKTNYQQSN